LKTIAAAIALVLLMAACAGGASQSSQPETPASQSPASQQPASPTATPEATEQPTPEPTAEAAADLEAIAEAFRASGVEIGEVREMTVDDYGAAPMGAQGLRFLIPSLGEDAGGRIILYDDPEVADRAQAYYEELGEQSALLFSHVFRRDNVVVQVNGTLPQEQADLLEAALDTVLPDDGS
jgi:hypothetical protein